MDYPAAKGASFISNENAASDSLVNMENTENNVTVTTANKGYWLSALLVVIFLFWWWRQK